MKNNLKIALAICAALLVAPSCNDDDDDINEPVKTPILDEEPHGGEDSGSETSKPDDNSGNTGDSNSGSQGGSTIENFTDGGDISVDGPSAGTGDSGSSDSGSTGSSDSGSTGTGDSGTSGSGSADGSDSGSQDSGSSDSGDSKPDDGKVEITFTGGTGK